MADLIAPKRRLYLSYDWPYTGLGYKPATILNGVDHVHREIKYINSLQLVHFGCSFQTKVFT